MSYYTKITTAGLAAITAAMNNSSKVPITYMAFGDGNGSIPEPDENATSLVNEVYRVGVNKVEVHNKNPNWLVCEAIIPSAVGGFNIREVALYDSTGNTMLAIASYPPTYKPTVEEGAAKIQTIRIVIQVDNSGTFELIVDPDVVLATKEDINNLKEKILDPETDTITAPMVRTYDDWNQRELNEGVIDVRKFIKKDLSNMTTGLQAAIEEAAGQKLLIPIPLRILDTIYINKGLSIEGTRSSVSNYQSDFPLIDFSQLGSNKNGFFISESSPVIGLNFKGFYLKGAKNGGSALKLGSKISNHVSDFKFEDGFFYGFSKGVEVNFSWDGIFDNIRIQSCDNGMLFENQANAILVNQARIVSILDRALSFINAEGIQLDTCDISNLSKASGAPISLFQSSVTFNTPYFENIYSPQLIRVGSVNQKFGSSLQINNPLKMGKNIVVSSSMDYVEITGKSRDKIHVIGSEISSPVTAKVSAPLNFNLSKVKFFWNPQQSFNFSMYGGSTITFNDYRNFFLVNSTSAAIGINIFNTLEVGKTYTLSYSIRKSSNAGTISIRHPNNTNNLLVDEGHEQPSVRYITFIASSSNLNLTWSGSIELYGFKIIEDNLSDFEDDPFNQCDFNNTVKVKRASLPQNGDWKSGDIISIKPSASNPVLEYQFAGNSWKATQWQTLSVSTQNLPILTINDVGVEIFDTTTNTFKKWSGTAWV